MWTLKSFDNLTNRELHAIYKLRTQVFVVEQNCPYQEVDDTDLNCQHLFQMDNERLTAYARLITDSDCVRIGRILVHINYRKSGLGKALVREAIDVLQAEYPRLPIHISAQAYLKQFYESFGFQEQSDVYLEDDIPHIDMVLN